MSLKSIETSNNLAAHPAVDPPGFATRTHPTLAPLASSETFSDVVSLYHDEQSKANAARTDEPLQTEQRSRRTTKINDFDSLEILFDFPSSNLSNEVQSTTSHPTEAPARIRFSENAQIININKVRRCAQLPFEETHFFRLTFTLGRTTVPSSGEKR